MKDRAGQILENTGQGFDIFRQLLPDWNSTSKNAIKSPLRNDKKPSFSIFQNDERVWLYKDHGTDETGNAIQFYANFKKLDFKDAMSELERQFFMADQKSYRVKKDTVDSDTKTEIQELRKIPCVSHPFWEPYGISDNVLEKYRVEYVEFLQFKGKNGKSIFRKSTVENPIFSYEWKDNSFKLYSPNDEVIRFSHLNKSGEYSFGLEQLHEQGAWVFIVGGEKDVLTMASLGFNAICLNSETANLSKELLINLVSRFHAVIVMYDTDITGEEASQKLAGQHDLINLRLNTDLPGKDISDFVKAGLNKDQFEKLVGKAIESHFDNFSTGINSLQFDPSRPVEAPVPVITLESSHILTPGNIMVISGKSKSGKSAFLYEILGTSISSSQVSSTAFGFEIAKARNEAIILHFDTEQSTYDWDKRLRIMARAFDLDYTRIQSHNLLGVDINNRLEFILRTIKKSLALEHSIHFVAIDGIADLLPGVNDEEAANKVISKLHKIAASTNVPVLTVLHLNPDGGKMRGHLGSQLERKAETTLVVDKDESGSSYISLKLCRNADAFTLPIQTFAWNNESKRHVHSGAAGKEKADLHRYEMLLDFVMDTFSESKGEPFVKKDFLAKICDHFKFTYSSSQRYKYLELMQVKELVTMAKRTVMPSGLILEKIKLESA